MSTTPEGKVKNKIKAVLRKVPNTYWHMPVQNGMGSPSLDFVGCSQGRFFAIEAKAPGEAPTPRQWLTIGNIIDAGGKVFVIDGRVEDLDHLHDWLRAS